ncbi:MAG: enoyl-CoA hydratase/isomerase family protein [Acidobacteria bacterium]|nr:enoyl-CoA hydratase/isomerase family protein [Acidobacteriota bacterium]
MRPYQSRPASSFAFHEIRYRKQGRIATISIDRKEQFNCFSTLTLEEMTTAFHDITEDDAIGVAILTGTGDRAFSTGGDVQEYQAEYVSRPRDYWKYIRRFQVLVDSILHNGKPTIARLNGIAVGGGNELQMACDLTVMAEHAYVKQVGTHVGNVAAGGATQWLPLLVGDKRAREILFLNRPIPARQALAWGLVNQVVPSVKKGGAFVENASEEQIRKAVAGVGGYSIRLELLDRAVEELAAKLLDSFPDCTRYTKEQLNFLKEFVWSSTVGHGADWLAMHFTGLEAFEGMSAFNQKRRADYKMVRDRLASDDSPETPCGANIVECPACGATGLPARFTHCGGCGAALKIISGPSRKRSEKAKLRRK